MEFGTMMQALSDLANGSFSQYDDTTSVIIVHVDEHRIQTVFAYDEGEKGIKFYSKACEATDDIPFDEIIKDNGSLSYAAIRLQDGNLIVDSRTLPGAQAGEGMKEMLLEVALTADKWELELTGKDVN